MAMDRSFSARGNFGSGGGGGGVGRGSVHNRLGAKPGAGTPASGRWNDGSSWVSGGKFTIDGIGSRDVTNRVS